MQMKKNYRPTLSPPSVELRRVGNGGQVTPHSVYGTPKVSEVWMQKEAQAAAESAEIWFWPEKIIG
jgi:hypothetical protein